MKEEEGVAAVVDWLVAGTVADIAAVDILAVAVVAGIVVVVAASAVVVVVAVVVGCR